ncbi:MAG: DUF1508 domain-containing protein [Bacteroidetes bacterium SB0662_bin_6]|nr:DUF1508 domain-containing protein [Bacteroidetes bacterium SB0668_bin_1]MYE04890.1 DUF1508 domain-containing protein [Bacteroidetes bacterium SB0662_bin_6]
MIVMTSNRYEVYRDSEKKWRWRLIVPRHGIVATSSQGFDTRDECVRQIRMVRSNVHSPVYDISAANPILAAF